MGKHKIIKSAAAVALTASVVATAAAPGASAASYKTNAKDQLVHTSTGKLVKGWKVFGGKLYKNGKLAPAKKYKIIGTGAAQKLFYGPTLKKGYKTANSKTLLFKDGKLADGWKQAGKNERLYKNGKLDKGYTVYTNVEGDKFLYQNGKLKKGQKTANRGGETLLFVDGKLAKGYVLHEASKTLFNNGKVAEGLVKYPETDGKFYNDGKLANGEINGAEYKDGVLVAKDIASVKAINDTTVEVTFKKDQKDVKASDFKIEGLEVKNAATKQGDDKIVILTTSKQEAGKEYTLVHKEADTKTFTAKSEVIPTAISTSTASVQGTVGKEVTLKAQVTVAEGQSKAGIPVTFNIDGDERSLNKDIVAETYTDENGVATYSYTQYNTASDTVAIYATGKPADRALSTVYWGVKDQLTIVENDTKGSTIANGDSKQYKVTYLTADGKPLVGKTLNVTFAENIGVKANQLSDATVTDKATGVTGTPYQLEDGKVEEVTVKTDENGVAIFTVSGTNTKVTPIVFESYNDKTGEQKLDARELQAQVASAVTFQGAQISHQISLTPAVEDNYTAIADATYDSATGLGGNANGRAYTLKVVDKDGKPYAGGTVNLAFNENLDKDAKTVTSAYFVSPETKKQFATGPKEADAQVTLDAKGEATVWVVSPDEKTYATPVAWIDQNTATNTQTGVLETGEPSFVGAITYFQAEAIKSSALNVLNGSTKVNTGTLKANEVATYQFEALNQSNNTVAVAKQVTYTIQNTGSSDVEYSTDGGHNWTTIHVGGSVTDVVTKETVAANNVQVRALDGKVASVKVEAKGYTLVKNDNNVFVNDKYLGTASKTVNFTKVLSVSEIAVNAINASKGAATKVETYNDAISDTIVNDNNFDTVKKAVVAAYAEKNADLTVKEIEKAVKDAVAEYDAAQAAALAQAKTDAKAALDTLAATKKAADYTVGTPAITQEVTAGKTAIDAATSTAAVTTAKDAAISAINDVKSDQVLADEAAAAANPAFTVPSPATAVAPIIEKLANHSNTATYAYTVDKLDADTSTTFAVSISNGNVEITRPATGETKNGKFELTVTSTVGAKTATKVFDVVVPKATGTTEGAVVITAK